MFLCAYHMYQYININVCIYACADTNMCTEGICDIVQNDAPCLTSLFVFYMLIHV